MEFKSGESRTQALLMPDCVDDYVGAEDPVRFIDVFITTLDLEELQFTRPHPKETGRPAYDPKDLLKLYVWGCLNRVRSSRRLETETKMNLGAIWLLGRLTPDYRTIARFRQENAGVLKQVFRSFVKECMKWGLYGRELAALDGSKFKAVNAKDRTFTKEKLQKRIERIDEKVQEYLFELDANDTAEAALDQAPVVDLKRIIGELRERKTRYQGYLEELETTGEPQKSLTDPESRLMVNNGKGEVGYNVQTVVDAKYKLIAEFEVTNQCNDRNQIAPMGKKAQEILETDTLKVITDAGYDSAQDIVEAMRDGIEVHVAGTDFDVCLPVEEGEDQREIASHQDGRCVYLRDRNIAVCPMGKVLYPGWYKKSRGHGVFYNREACKQCTCKCTKEKYGRKYQVPLPEGRFTKEYNDEGLKVRQRRITGDKGLVKERKSIAEHPFGTVKQSMDGRYCLLKGIQKVRGEFSLLFLAYNIKRAIKILGIRRMLEAYRPLSVAA